MGLVESSQNRSFPWGPAKSRSANQFPGGRNYDARPRQAATLPARKRVIESSLEPGSHFLDDSFDYQDCAAGAVDQSKGLIDDDSMDNIKAVNKRRSDPMGGYFGNVCNGTEINDLVIMDSPFTKYFLPHSDESLCVRDDSATDPFRMPYFRTSVSFPFYNSGLENDADIVTCEEKQTQTSPPSTLDKASLNWATSKMVPKPVIRNGRRRSRGRISNKVSTSVPANPGSQPYIELHYEGSESSAEKRGEDKCLHNSLSRASLYINGDKSVVIPNSEKSQVFIRCNAPSHRVNECDNDKFKGVQMSPNVWFESSITPTKRKAAHGLLRRQSSDSNLANIMKTTVDSEQNTHITHSPNIFIKGYGPINCQQKLTSHPIPLSEYSSNELLACEEKIGKTTITTCGIQKGNHFKDSNTKERESDLSDDNLLVPLCISESGIPNNVSSAFNLDEAGINRPSGSNLAPSLGHNTEDDVYLHVVDHVTEGGTFPILRLPRPEGQANLVDILASTSLAENFDAQEISDERRSTTLPNSVNKKNMPAADSLFQCEDNSIVITYDKKYSESNPNIRLGIDEKHPTAVFVGAASSCALSPHELNTLQRRKCICESEYLSDTDISSMCAVADNCCPIEYCELRGANENDQMPSSEKLLSDEKDCGFTCHEQCQDVVSLDCKTALCELTADELGDIENDLDQEPCATPTKPDDVTDDEIEAEEKHEEELQEKDLGYCDNIENEQVSTLRRTVCRIQSQMVVSSEIEEWVEKYSSANQGLQIAKEKDGSYRGCLRIHLNLSRPINIVAGTRPPSIYDILQEDRTIEKTLTSFYMPRDAVKAIHITSKTTTREVIIALLKKFKVVDNPQKFALYEKTYDGVQSMKAKLHRLGDSECPLVLAIAWGAQSLTNKWLVLQENDTADIQWDAFSLPELYNFLRILDKEEVEYKNQIRDKYSLLRKRINDHLLHVSTS